MHTFGRFTMQARTLLALISLASISACSSHHRSAEPKQATAPAAEPAPSTAASGTEVPNTIPYNAALETKQNAIATELQHLDLASLPLNHWAREWAGTYYTGDGLGMNVHIRIAPNTGVIYTWNGCVGLYDSAFGDIVETFPGGVRIALKTPDKPSYFDYMSDTLYFVRWGDLRFLVPETQLQKMVDNFNEGGFARTLMFNIPRKRGDHTPRTYKDACPSGMPELPPAYAAKLVDHVIHMRVIHTSEAFGRTEKWQVEAASFRVRLNAGREQGVFPDLCIFDSVNGVGRSLAIDSVDQSTCMGTLTLYADPATVPQSPMAMTFDYRGGKLPTTK
jgi:hypothetical protein